MNVISEMWLAWIEDERKLATTAEEKEKLIELFERALKDYLCKLYLVPFALSIQNFRIYQVI